METKKSQLEGLPEKTQGNEKGLGKKVQPMIEKEYIEREAAQKVLANDYAYNAAKLLDTVPMGKVIIRLLVKLLLLALTMTSK